VLEARLDLFMRLRQRGPELQPVVHVGVGLQALGLALGVHDAAPRGHPVDRAGQDLLHAAQAVAMHHRALEKIGDRRQADVRMRPHVVLGAGLLGGRPEMVEEHEGPDRAALRRGQQAPHVEATAQVLVVRLKQLGVGRWYRSSCSPWGWFFATARSCHCGNALAECAGRVEVALEHLGRARVRGRLRQRPP
jgi:hypothetical protein